MAVHYMKRSNLLTMAETGLSDLGLDSFTVFLAPFVI